MPISIILTIALFAQSGIAQGQHIENKATICQIHKCKLYKSLVPVIHGLVISSYSRTYSEAEKTLFPKHHVSYVNYGCEVGYDTSVEMFFCAECDIARKNWLRSHPSEWHIGMDPENADLEKEELEKIGHQQPKTIFKKMP